MEIEKIKEQALKIARENKNSEPNIVSVYWFPDNKEIRILELENDFVQSPSGSIEPYYFSHIQEDITCPSGIAVIRTDEFQRLHLPKHWGRWDKAQKLEI